MSEPLWLTTPELAKFWRVNRSMLSTLRSKGMLLIGRWGKRYPPRTICYLMTELDAYHRGHLHPGCDHFPSMRELLAYQKATGQPALLTIDEVTGELGVSPKTLHSLIVQYNLPTVRIGSLWRIAAPSFERMKSQYTGDETIDGNDVSRIIGVSVAGLYLWRIKNTLPFTYAHSRGRGRPVLYDQESFMAFLERAVRNCTPQEWLTLRETHNYELLLTIRKIKMQFPIPELTLRSFLQPGKGSWPYLLLPAGDFRIPLHLVEEWLNSIGRGNI